MSKKKVDDSTVAIVVTESVGETVEIVKVEAPAVAEKPCPLDAYPWAGNEKCVPHAAVAGLSADDLEARGYVVVRTGLGGTVLRRF